MKETPTSGPVTMSMSQNARADSSSRHSFSSSHVHAGLREGKEDLFEPFGSETVGTFGVARCRGRGQFLDRAFAAHSAAAQKHEAIAESLGVGDLVDGKK